jgi:phage gp36-like protein
MTYAAQADMETRFGDEELIQLTDRANTGAIDATVLGQALADANAEVDLYLARYNPPLPSVPPMLIVLACDIARYRLYDDAPTDAVRQRYEDAVAKLRDIAAGKIDLGQADGTPQPLGAPQIDAPARVWSADTLADY